MTIDHITKGVVQQTIIKLATDDVLYVQSTVHDKTFRFKAGQDKFNINTFDSVKLIVEDNLFVVETVKQGKTDQKAFSETWGFYVEKYN